MSIVFACIAPHSGHLMLDPLGPTHIPKSWDAMQELARLFAKSQADSVALMTPHGIYIEGAMSIGICPRASGELDGLTVSVETDLDLAAAWAYHASELGVPIAPLAGSNPNDVFPLDWGATIPLALLAPSPLNLPTVIACPARNLSNEQLIAWGEALVMAANETKKRVALIVSADQGHGHAANGPYGFAPESAQYDAAMVEAVQTDDLPRLLQWDPGWIDAALADSYWQTLSLIGVQKHIPLRAQFLSYEVDHYFGLLCAAFIC